MKSPVRVLTLSLLVIMSVGSCAHRKTSLKQAKTAALAAPPPEPISIGTFQTLPFVGTFQVHRTQLENGLKILVVEDHSSPTFAFQTWFKVGSREEIAGKTGLAHLFEHMMFKETKSLKDGAFDRMMEEAGSEGTNAFTTTDYTAYVEELPKDRLEMVMQLESDRMVNLVVDEKNFSTEREVVQNERKMRYENNPNGQIWLELNALAYTQHPYHWPVIGTDQDLRAMTASSARDFYKLWYSPNKATVIVVGDVQASQVFSMAKRFYGSIPAAPESSSDITMDLEPTSPKRKTLKQAIQVERLLISYPIPSVQSADMPALFILSGVLTSGKSSRLYRDLVETGLATSVSSGAYEKRDPGQFIFDVNMQKGKKSSQAEAVIMKEIQNLIQTPVGMLELDRAKSQIRFEYFDQLNETSNIAQFLGTYETLLGDFQLGVRMIEATKSVTSEQVQEMAKKYLSPQRKTVLQGIPQRAASK